MYNLGSLIGLWYRVKYDSPWKHSPITASKFWKLFCKTAVAIKPVVSLSVHHNSNLSFLWDPWCNNGSVAELTDSIRISHLWVGDFISSNGWNLPDYIPASIKSIISNLLIVREGPVLTWNSRTVTSCPNNRTFSELFHSNLEDVPWFKFIWHKGYALWYASYSWMAIQRKLKMADILNLRGIPLNPNCSFCLGNLESHSHVYFECDYSFLLLTALFPDLVKFYLRPNLMQVFDIFGSYRNFTKVDRNFCYFVMAILVYHLWRERNNRRFSSVWRSPSELKNVIIHAIEAKASNWRHYDSLKNHFKEILG
ncbi:uncharacterized protein LOC114579444 [Dendrobium catenatum]|uniref:uncharacterized protein LOC114579444 n=1 Tax=Dendrobium catenatum TaxID=906689 RepID=UPI0010A044BF|nr:uncharacterized protein LOC114579444 [Dendrobium catenatum]